MTKQYLFPFLLLTVVACDPGHFDQLRNESNWLIVNGPPGSASFGRSLHPLVGELQGRPASRILVTGGANSPYSMLGGLTLNPLLDDLGQLRTQGCLTETECGSGRSRASASLPSWLFRSGTNGEMCTAVSVDSGGTTALEIRCESTRATPETLPLAAGAGFQLADGSLGTQALLVAEPSAGEGSLSVLMARPTAGGNPELVPIVGDFTPGLNGGALGSSMVSRRVGPDRLWVLLAGQGVVSLVEVRESSPRNFEGTPRACWTRAASDWRLALGDVSGDGQVDVVFHPRGQGSLEYLDGASLTEDAPASCDQAPTTIIACPASLGTCDGSFGDSVAVLQMASEPTLVVGAPEARIGDVDQAGAVYLGRLTGGNFEWVRLQAPIARAGALFGYSVAGVASDFAASVRREELVVGAPGSSEVHFVLCSGALGDRPGDVPGGLRTCVPRGGA